MQAGSLFPLCLHRCLLNGGPFLTLVGSLRRVESKCVFLHPNVGFKHKRLQAYHGVLCGRKGKVPCHQLIELDRLNKNAIHVPIFRCYNVKRATNPMWLVFSSYCNRVNACSANILNGFLSEFLVNGALKRPIWRISK